MKYAAILFVFAGCAPVASAPASGWLPGWDERPAVTQRTESAPTVITGNPPAVPIPPQLAPPAEAIAMAVDPWAHFTGTKIFCTTPCPHCDDFTAMEPLAKLAGWTFGSTPDCHFVHVQVPFTQAGFSAAGITGAPEFVSYVNGVEVNRHEGFDGSRAEFDAILLENPRSKNWKRSRRKAAAVSMGQIGVCTCGPNCQCTPENHCGCGGHMRAVTYGSPIIYDAPPMLAAPSCSAPLVSSVDGYGSRNIFTQQPVYTQTPGWYNAAPVVIPSGYRARAGVTVGPAQSSVGFTLFGCPIFSAGAGTVMP